MRILITTFGTLGDVHPYLALAHGLAARGHAPAIGTSELHRATVEGEGIAFRPIRPHLDPTDRELFERAMDPLRGPQVVVREVMLPRLRESWEDTDAAAADADLIVTHPLAFAGPIVAEARGIRWASSVLAPLSFFSRHDFPVVPPVPWARHLYGVPGVPRLLRGLFRAITRSWTDPVRELRAEIGLGPGGDPLYEGQHSPRLVLALFSRVLADPQPDWPPHTVATGFLFHAPSGGSEAGARMLEASLDAGPPPVVFTLGSSLVGLAGDFFDESLAAARRIGRRAVLLVGDEPGNGPDERGDDALVVGWASHAALFPRAAAVVHHGGIGTLGRALEAGRPMVVVPHSHDQPDNAWRAARLGVARVIPARRYRSDRAADALADLLGDPAVTRRAEEVGRTVRSEDGVRAACDAIEALARGG